MTGGTSQIDLLDPKPLLRQHHGSVLPQSIIDHELQFANVTKKSTLMASPFDFTTHSETGIDFSELLPHMGKLLDEMCIIRSMCCDEINHPAAQLLFQTGFPRRGRPSMGAWIGYGLGTENESLPSFVLLQSGSGNECAEDCYSSGFLPSRYRAVPIRGGENPMDYLLDPPGLPRKLRRSAVDATSTLNREWADRTKSVNVFESTHSLRAAFDLQIALPSVMDVSKESQETLNLYGIDSVAEPSFALHCLIARRMVQNGVRFIQLNHGDWDLHGNLKTRLPGLCTQVDRGSAALVADLKRSGLLDETLVIWGSEFGRTPMLEGRGGRDHHRWFSIWMAGGRIEKRIRFRRDR